MRGGRRGAIAAALWVTLVAPAFAADAPDWLREAAKAPTPSTQAPAVILLHQGQITLEESGLVRQVERGAVRVTDGPGRQWCRPSCQSC